MKTTIIIEQCDNGIVVEEHVDDGSNIKTVSLDHTKVADIGKTIWEDIVHVMDSECKNKVRVELEITAEE